MRTFLIRVRDGRCSRVCQCLSWFKINKNVILIKWYARAQGPKQGLRTVLVSMPSAYQQERKPDYPMNTPASIKGPFLSLCAVQTRRTVLKGHQWGIPRDYGMHFILNVVYTVRNYHNFNSKRNCKKMLQEKPVKW